MSQSQSQRTTPTALTGSVFPSSCSHFLRLTLGSKCHTSRSCPFQSSFHWGKKIQLLQMYTCEKLSLPTVTPIPSAPKSLQTAFRSNTSKNMKQSEDSKHIKITEDLWTSGCRSGQCISFVGDGDSPLHPEISLFNTENGKDLYDTKIYFASICQGSIRRRAGKKELILL